MFYYPCRKIQVSNTFVVLKDHLKYKQIDLWVSVSLPAYWDGILNDTISYVITVLLIIIYFLFLIVILSLYKDFYITSLICKTLYFVKKLVFCFGLIELKMRKEPMCLWLRVNWSCKYTLSIFDLIVIGSTYLNVLLFCRKEVNFVSCVCLYIIRYEEK